jgi:hypothetical protein
MPSLRFSAVRARTKLPLHDCRSHAIPVSASAGHCRRGHATLDHRTTTTSRAAIAPAWLGRVDGGYREVASLGSLPRLVALDGLRATFELDEPLAAEVVPGLRAYITNEFDPIRMDILMDRSRVWKARRFVATDATQVGPDGKTEVVVGGWDHEHCAVCWAKIHEDAPDGFCPEGKWMCTECHRQYITGGLRDRIGDRV